MKFSQSTELGNLFLPESVIDELAQERVRTNNRVNNTLNSEDPEKKEKLRKEIENFPNIFAQIFNHHKSKEVGIFSLDDSWQEHGQDQINETAYSTLPAIGVFKDGSPYLINGNYLKSIGAKSLQELIQQTKADTALETYYTPESAKKARDFLATLNIKGSGYQDLILETKDGKILNWSSHSLGNGYSIRICSDVTHNDGKLLLPNTKNEKPELYLNAYKKSLSYEALFGAKIPDEIKVIFGAIDVLWDNSQYIFNITDLKNPSFMQYNHRYLQATGLTKERFDELLKTGKLWDKIYSTNTLEIIKSLHKKLIKDGSYFDGFPIISDNGRKVTEFLWYRSLISGDKTIGVGSPTFGKGESDLEKFLKEFS